MADYTIEQIEDAIITALGPLKTSIGIRVIKTYSGDLDSEEALKEAMAMQFPAIYIVYGGLEAASHGERKMEEMSYSLFVCAKSLRKEEEARRGGAQNPGTYVMLDAIKEKLWGKQLSLEIEPFELKREMPIWFGKGLSIYAAEYKSSKPSLYPK